jgi:hypothetical protein
MKKGLYPHTGMVGQASENTEEPGCGPSFGADWALVAFRVAAGQFFLVAQIGYSRSDGRVQKGCSSKG